MIPLEIITRYYDPASEAGVRLIRHSEQVAKKALGIAENLKHLNPDHRFIEEAALLHDIGIFYTDAPSIGCFGEHPYVCHGYLGRALMDTLGYPRHGLVCERHVGAGLNVDEICRHHLPLPVRSMVPVSLEEEIICYADKFFSKNGENREKELPMDAVMAKIETYGPAQLVRFKTWAERFEPAAVHIRT
jgi:uncharacterized protein